MTLMAAAPLQIEKMVAVKRERPQQHNIGVHPQPAMLVEQRISEDVAEIADLGAGDDALEHAPRHDIGGGAYFDPMRSQKFELLGRLAPDPHRVPGGPHRGRRGDEAVMLGRVRQYLVKAVNLRQPRAAVQERRDPCVQIARQPPPLRR